MQELFQKYVQGNCTDKEYVQVRDFIKDKKNNLYLNGLLMSDWKAILRQEQHQKPDQELLKAIHYQIALQESAKKTRLIKTYKAVIGVAAVSIFALIFGAVFYLDSFKPEITAQTYKTPYGGKMQVELPDGSNVWLNAGSTLNFPSRFEGTRKVHLEGEAYFDVVSNTEKFIVESVYGNVEVLGTEFNMKAYDNNEFATTLVEGAIRFYTPSGKSVDLEPGKQVRIEKNKYLLRSSEVELAISWKDGRMIFKDEPLENMLKRLERWYNVDIELKDERLKDLKYNGTIEMESFSEVLELIKVTTPITYDFDRDTRILSIGVE
ncbi:FecR domain-containing protein [uncultured Draconibacterium sp.]|uniref:FecR family protein n=1 Tax=uncultured Draconibacterium sp. TaxID=1573823 RepID=UPI0029C8A426|nr:FecR domain-containing protein [uncultured Draconibacterium sp.]